MAELFSSQTADNFWYVLLFLFVGAFVGYFVGKMLLQKTIHVFRSCWLLVGDGCGTPVDLTDEGGYATLTDPWLYLFKPGEKQIGRATRLNSSHRCTSRMPSSA